MGPGHGPFLTKRTLTCRGTFGFIRYSPVAVKCCQQSFPVFPAWGAISPFSSVVLLSLIPKRGSSDHPPQTSATCFCFLQLLCFPWALSSWNAMFVPCLHAELVPKQRLHLARKETKFALHFLLIMARDTFKNILYWVTVLMAWSYSSHSIQFIHLKCAIQCFLVYSRNCTAITTT